MAWYKNGTIAISGATVTGTGTNWTDNKSGIGPGQALLVPAAGTVKMYEILRVDSATKLTLTSSAGTVAAGSAYAIMSFYTDSVPDFARRLSAQLSYYQTQMDGWQQIMTSTGSVTIEAPDGTQVMLSSFKKLTSDMSSKADLVKGTVAIEQGGTGSNSPFGSIAGSFAQGNDKRLNTVDDKTGGVIKGGVTVTPVSGDLTGPRSFIGAGSLDLYATSLPNIAFYTGNAATYTSRFIEASAGIMALQAGGGIARLRVEGGIVCRAGLTGVSRSNCFNFDFSGGTLLYIDQTLIGSVNTSSVSDKRLKKDVAYQTGEDNVAAYEQVLQWRPATFKFKARGELIPESDTKLGIIANDLVEISPECVDGQGLDDTYDGINPYNAYYLDHDAMLMKLTMAVQHQAGLIEKLQAEIQSLKSGS